jgi:hypothetical protein
MNIDFHYGVIYIVSRLAGLEREDAEVVAHACQYVDDATTDGVLEFAGGESFDRFASAHKLLDYKNELNAQNRLVWAPFHFLPGGDGDSLDEKAVCRPDSTVARRMVRRAIDDKQADNALHRLGVTLHVYVDTWAHQGFSGIKSNHNIVTALEAGRDYPHEACLAWLKERFEIIESNVEARLLNLISKLGHGSALSFPDWPWAKWSYRNGHGQMIHRDNLPDFMAAADMACKAVQGFIRGNQRYEMEAGLPPTARTALQTLLGNNREQDQNNRLATLGRHLADGHIPGLKESIPGYTAKGRGSWKFMATGLERDEDELKQPGPSWSPDFETSDYRKFHDAIKEHRFVVTQQLLPAPDIGLRLA